MDEKTIKKLLEKYRKGRLAADDLVRELKNLPFEDLGFAKVDHHRAIRCGFPEVIFCPGKAPEHITAIADRIVRAGGLMLATRADRKAFRAVKKSVRSAKYHEKARCVTVGSPKKRRGLVLIVSAGTSDIPVAEEARVTADMMGANVRPIYDVGVAGVHRLLRHSKELRKASALVVVAGMDGALPSVVGGMVARPVIAVPTSVGYGASFKGIGPLLTMLNSCASGVSVVNIDNGFGAGYLAAMIANPQ